MFEPKTDEDYKYVKYAKTLIKIFTGMDKIVYCGLENLVTEGPNLISANHPDIGKGIGAIIKLYLEEANRKTDFIARKEIFTQEEFKQLIDTYAKRNIPRRMLQLALKPLQLFLGSYIPRAVTTTGMIPLDINTQTIKATRYNLRVISNSIEPKLVDGKAIVLLQYSRNKTSSPWHYYLQRFHQTPARIALQVFNHSGLAIPVTPISIYGGRGILPLKKIVVNVGKPLYITDFMEEQNPIKAMADLLEKRTAQLLEESGLKDDPEKHRIDKRYMSKTN